MRGLTLVFRGYFLVFSPSSTFFIVQGKDLKVKEFKERALRELSLSLTLGDLPFLSCFPLQKAEKGKVPSHAKQITKNRLLSCIAFPSPHGVNVVTCRGIIKEAQTADRKAQDNVTFWGAYSAKSHLLLTKRVK